MVNPSGIRHSENNELEVHEVRQGLYTVENAYVGNYEYFKNRPITIEQKKSIQPSEEAVHSSGGF
jgi:hypothetical protein